MKIWEIENIDTLVFSQPKELSKEIISDIVNVPTNAVVWVEEGVGFFIDSRYHKFETSRVVIFRIVSEYLVIHIGIDTMEHVCIDLNNPKYKSIARKYLIDKAGGCRKQNILTLIRKFLRS